MNNIQWLSIRASAGSGKTFALTLRYISLLFLGARVNEILCVTFTNKAQQEMQERILKTLLDLSNDTPTPYFDELLKLGVSKDIIASKKKAIYENFISSNNHIMTFDAFFNMILKKFSFYAGISSNYEIGVNYNSNEEVFNKSLNSLIDDEFNLLVKFCSSNNIMSKDLLNMINKINIDDYSIRNITLKDDFKEDLIETFNSLCSYILEITEGKKGVASLRKRFDKTYDVGSINSIIDSINLTDKMQETLEKINYDKEFYNLKINKIKDIFKSYFIFRENEILGQIIKFNKLYKRFKNSTLATKNKLNFSDINMLCYDLLNKHIDRDFFYFRLDSRINHILVDEFQDTNIKQYEILKPLIDEIKSGIGRVSNRSLFFVGDEKQAIYAFRGSDSKLFKEISKVLGMNIVSLPKNYRSSKNIIHFVNETFKDIFSDYETQLQNSTTEGYVEVITKEEKGEILFSIKHRILNLLQNNRKDICILTRKSSSAKEIYDYLINEINGIKISIKIKDSINKEFLIIKNALLYLYSKNELYLKNCYKLNGDSFYSNIKLEIDINLSPSKITLKIMEYFRLYGKVAILILENAVLYDGLDEFIEFLKNADIEVIEDNKCNIKIMNIHNSKGLEFSDVIVCEYSKERHSNDIFYYDYKGLSLDRIYYLKDSKYRKYVDEEFNFILEKKQQEERLDGINLLYVAFTRAKESLYIIKTQKGIFDILNLKDFKIGKDIISSKEVNNLDSTVQNLLVQSSFGKQDDFINDENISYTTKSRLKGVALHLALEFYLKYNMKEDEISQVLLNRFGLILNDSERLEVLKSMQNILNNTTIRDILENAINIKCEISYLDSSLKRIDCLIETKDNIFLLDYKSSDLDLVVKEKQVKEYLQYVRKYYSNVTAYLCFADGRISEVK
ncbi:RecB-like helicase [Helicobacter sp. MIT 14-3879]|uniref:RecB-like helicase n=1 Tax=Helicobacter sp. MIT 14-3879 TaxID=2040649 RepID=UPI000E1F2736|nr:RecB-like helicase [Helicobacter sp. MIT 14-3879]RDU65443.1 RecB-like helicase [Helicobacter sp. MIT 14-3879]